jgi:aspartyl-tRNA(Asn)/glutamyl-tRNA(Gln) amidotransferase subunit A
MPPEKIPLMDPGLVELCRSGEAVTQQQYVDAIGKRVAVGTALRQFFERYDLILSPSMPIPAAYAEPRRDGAPDPINYREWLSYTWAFNLTKNPSASIPCGFADGLPLGLMITGPLYDDLSVLQACHGYEEAAGAAWPSPELAAALAKAEGAAGPEVTAKIRPVA